MTAPAELATEEVVQGDSWKPVYTLTSGGVPFDLSGAGVEVTLSLFPVGGGTPITRKLSGSSQAAFVTDGKDGRIQFIFTPAESLAISAGWYRVVVEYEKAADNIKVTHARGGVHFTLRAA